MKKNSHLFLLLFVLIIAEILPVTSQEAIPVIDLDQDELPYVWQNDFRYSSADIQWTMVTSSGTFIVAKAQSMDNGAINPARILGYDQKTGDVLFNYKVTRAKSYTPDSFEEIPNTPLIALSNSQRKQDQIVINTLNGKVVAESDKAGMSRVYNRFVLMNAEKILYVGRKGMKSVVAMFDMKTGEFWSKEKMFRHKMVEETVNSSIVEIDEKSVLISTEGGLYCINSTSGETIWRAGIPSYIQSPQMGTSNRSSNSKNKITTEEVVIPPAKIYKHPDKDVAYYLCHMGLMAYDIKTGEKKWKKFKKADGNYSFLPGDDHLMILGSRTNAYHYETGESLWEKPTKIKGKISHKSLHKLHLIFATESLNQISKNLTYKINAIDLKTGVLAQKKGMSVNGAINSFHPCESGVFYLTDKEINMYDLSTGATVFKDPVTIRKGSHLTDAIKDKTNIGRGSDRILMTKYENNVYFYNTKDNKLYCLDIVNNTIKPLLLLPFGKKKERITTIEMRNKNIYMSSEQNLYLINSDGKLLYHTYYSPIEGLAFLAYSLSMEITGILIQEATAAFNRSLEVSMGKAKVKYISEGKGMQEIQNRAAYVKHIDAPKITSPNYKESSLYKAIHSRKSLAAESRNIAMIHGRIKQKDPLFGIIAGEFLNSKKAVPNIKSFILAQINKDTGETEKIFDLGGDIEATIPAFSIDEIGGKFYLIKNKKVYCFNM